MDKIWKDKEQYFGQLFAMAINHEWTHNISSLENIHVKLKEKKKTERRWKCCANGIKCQIKVSGDHKSFHPKPIVLYCAYNCLKHRQLKAYLNPWYYWSSMSVKYNNTFDTDSGYTNVL